MENINVGNFSSRVHTVLTPGLEKIHVEILVVYFKHVLAIHIICLREKYEKKQKWRKRTDQ